ncbi:hypothetical protein Q5P01_018235 [Channa striata]|uniref:EF-hand domain-containing protein n=1 Tax=Channa striata TaxID=64152 RepID=A0AA88SFP3_CHASR|nr:hypothetical protein Q5P01_018235 [Channa striata]
MHKSFLKSCVVAVATTCQHCGRTSGAALSVRPSLKMSEMSAMNRKLIQALAESISKQVEHFNKTEVECLIREFNVLMGEPTTLGKTVNGLDRGKFRTILHNNFGMTDDMIMDGVFRTFDKDNDSFVNMKEWIEGLSIFLRGTLDEKIKYCFHVYDLNGDKYISREEMFHMLKNSLITQPTEEDPDEGIKDLVEITLKKMDHDHDGRLSFGDFDKAVREENLCLKLLEPASLTPRVLRHLRSMYFRNNWNNKEIIYYFFNTRLDS